MHKYEYLEIVFDEGLFLDSITVAYNASSKNIHDLMQIENTIKEMTNPALVLEILNDYNWEFISSHSKGQHGLHTKTA